MKLVYPPNGHTTAESQTFVIGSVEPGQAVSVNGQGIPTSAKGYFAYVLPLRFGDNTFRFAPAGEPERTLTLRRKLPIVAPNGTIQPDVKPMVSQIVMPGDWVAFQCVAGPDQTITAILETPEGAAVLSVPLKAAGHDGYVDNRTAVFAELTQTQPLIAKQCWYTGTGQIPACTPETGPLAVRFKTATHTVASKATVTLWDHARFGVLTADRVVMRTSPPEGSRLTPQRKGTPVVLTGKKGDWWRVRLSGEQTAWLPADKLQLLDQPPAVRNIPAFTLKTRPLSDNQSILVLPGLPHAVPFHVETTPDGLVMDWFGVVSHCDFIHYHPAEKVIQGIQWSQPNADTFRLTLQVKRLCGFEVSFTPDGAEVRVKRLPTTPRILIDPGHGGTETGSTGPDGTPEKALNLSLSLKVADALRQQGLDITLSRTRDVTLGLTERTTQAEAFDLVLSIHHNALPDGRDPGKTHGLSTFYYHGMTKPLADHLASSLSASLPTRLMGVFYDSLALTRIPQAMAVLIEIGFMTHPEEYEQLQSAEYQQKTASHLAHQLKRFIETNA